jgi:ATP-binding protein involved in chromosome partitioning
MQYGPSRSATNPNNPLTRASNLETVSRQRGCFDPRAGRVISQHNLITTDLRASTNLNCDPRHCGKRAGELTSGQLAQFARVLRDAHKNSFVVHAILGNYECQRSHFSAGGGMLVLQEMPSPNEILAELKKIKYPGFTRHIVSFGIIKDIEIAYAGVTVTLAAPTANPETIKAIASEVTRVVGAMPGVPAVKIQIEQTQPAARAQPSPLQKRSIPKVDHIVAVASGKGGVGKSTCAVNLALALSSLGQSVGLMDADVYGPSVAMMVGYEEQVKLAPDRRIIPLERYGIRYVSMAFFINDETPVIWRGPMVTKLEAEFLFNVEWGELDVLIIDLPPGTGDAQLTITQRVALDGGVIVTTPQNLALLDVRRGVAMFVEVKTPVLGVIENMSYHLCRKCHQRHEIFSHGGGARLAAELGVPFLGELPISTELRDGLDRASPLVATDPAHPVSKQFQLIAGKILQQLVPAGVSAAARD